jgi:hypothetical protein
MYKRKLRRHTYDDAGHLQVGVHLALMVIYMNQALIHVHPFIQFKLRSFRLRLVVFFTLSAEWRFKFELISNSVCRLGRRDERCTRPTGVPLFLSSYKT